MYHRKSVQHFSIWRELSSKKPEILWLRDQYPELLERALRIEQNAQAKLTWVKGLCRYLIIASDHHLTRLFDPGPVCCDC